MLIEIAQDTYANNLHMMFQFPQITLYTKKIHGQMEDIYGQQALALKVN